MNKINNIIIEVTKYLINNNYNKVVDYFRWDLVKLNDISYLQLSFEINDKNFNVVSKLNNNDLLINSIHYQNLTIIELDLKLDSILINPI